MSGISKKQEIVSEIKGKLEKAKSLVLIDARGLSVSDDSKLRKQLREAGVDYKVYKNKLTLLAIKDTPFESLKDDLKGPSTMAFSYEEPTQAARIVNGNLKDMKALEFKAGVLEGEYYDRDSIQKIASILPVDQLQSKLLGSFKSPLATFARLISQIAEKKEAV